MFLKYWISHLAQVLDVPWLSDHLKSLFNTSNANSGVFGWYKMVLVQHTNWVYILAWTKYWIWAFSGETVWVYYWRRQESNFLQLSCLWLILVSFLYCFLLLVFFTKNLFLEQLKGIFSWCFGGNPQAVLLKTPTYYLKLVFHEGPNKGHIYFKSEAYLSLISAWTFAPETDSLNERVRRKKHSSQSSLWRFVCLSPFFLSQMLYHLEICLPAFERVQFMFTL